MRPLRSSLRRRVTAGPARRPRRLPTNPKELLREAKRLHRSVGDQFATLTNTDFDTFFSYWNDRDDLESFAGDVEELGIFAGDLATLANKLATVLDALVNTMPEDED